MAKNFSEWHKIKSNLDNVRQRQCFDAAVILSQIRLFDASRLSNKIAVLNKEKFMEIKKALKDVNFS